MRSSSATLTSLPRAAAAFSARQMPDRLGLASIRKMDVCRARESGHWHLMRTIRTCFLLARIRPAFTSCRAATTHFRLRSKDKLVWVLYSYRTYIEEVRHSAPDLRRFP